MVQIRVKPEGPGDSTKVSVHRDVIGSSSEILRICFSTSKDTELDCSHLPQTHFTIYVNWLYTGIVRTEQNVSQDPGKYRLLVELYLMGDDLRDKKFKNAIISVLLGLARQSKAINAKTLPDEDCIRRAYAPRFGLPNQTAKPLRRALVEIYANEENTAHWSAIKDKVNQEFLGDLSLRLMDLRLAKHKNLAEVRICDFHEHKPKEQCDKQEPAKKRKRED